MKGVTELPATLAETPIDPGRFWIRFAPRRWPLVEGWWTHLSSARLGPAGLRSSPGPVRLADGADDAVYLPPVPRELKAWRDDLAAGLAEAGIPSVVQLLPGEPIPAAGDAVFDLTPWLLAPEPIPIGDVRLSSHAAWPLVAGITDGAERALQLGSQLREAGVRTATVVPLELTPRQKRELAEGRDPAVFEALFHRGETADSRLASALAQAGLRPFMPRPEPAGSPAFLARHRLVGLLAEAGEMELRRGSDSQGHSHYRAARHLDEVRLDPVSLHREGNLKVLRWLDRSSRVLIERALEGDPDPLAEIRDRYLDREERGSTT